MAGLRKGDLCVNTVRDWVTVETEVRHTWSSWPGVANLEMGVQVAYWGEQRTTIYYVQGLQNRTRVLWRKVVGSKLMQSTCHNCQDRKKTLENRAGRTEAKESVYMGHRLEAWK